MPHVIIDNLSQLPDLTGRSIVLDVETTSFKDQDSGFEMFRGHRACGIAVSVYPYNGDAWYLPVRHRGVGRNIPLDAALQWARQTLLQSKEWINHNIKFDAKVLWHDDIWVGSPKLLDTLVLARLVYNPLPDGTISYDLESLAKKLLGERKPIDEVKQFLSSVSTKDFPVRDFGAVPVQLLGRYAMEDVHLTSLLYQHLIDRLPEVSKDLWQQEIKLQHQLLKAEIRGTKVRVDFIKEAWRQTLYKQLKLIDEINGELQVLTGCEELDLHSPSGTQRAMELLKVDSISFTNKGHPQWNQVNLRACGHPLGAKLADLKQLITFAGSYCEGWLDRVGHDGRLHCTYNLAGTRTGRMSASNPNMQNITKRRHVSTQVEDETLCAEFFVVPDDGCNIVAWDYSQLEYRYFAHYTNDPKIVQAYRSDPNVDFHEQLAKALGVPRQFAKTMNFSMIYGMGKKKLLKMIAGMVAMAKDNTTKEQMYAFALGAEGAAKAAERMSLSEANFQVAESLYREYHRRVPSIRPFNNQVTAMGKHRGWLKNFYGRIYRFNQDNAHKGLNTLIQGSAGDMVKQRLCALLTEVSPVLPNEDGVHLVTTVHDSVFLSVPKEETQRILTRGTAVLEDVANMRVPIRVEAKLSTSTMAEAVKLKTLDEIHAMELLETENVDEGSDENNSD